MVFVNIMSYGKKRNYSYCHCFSQIIVCGECGELFKRIHWNNRGCKSIVWRCISRLEPTGCVCHARTVNEKVLENVVVQAINRLIGDKSNYLEVLQRNIAKVITDESDDDITEIDEELKRLEKELVMKAKNKDAYDQIADEILRLREKRHEITMDTAMRDEKIERINNLQEFIREQNAELTEYDESLVKRWLSEITVFDDRFSVELKSGIKVEIEG